MQDEARREPQLLEPDLQVAQSINIAPGIMANLNRIASARLPRHAALPIVHILAELCSLEELDELFQDEWDRILEGAFEAWACNRRWRRDIAWEDIFDAKRALLRLMERRGMNLKVEGRDPLSVFRDGIEARIQRGKFAPSQLLDSEGDDDE